MDGALVVVMDGTLVEVMDGTPVEVMVGALEEVMDGALVVVGLLERLAVGDTLVAMDGRLVGVLVLKVTLPT